MLYNNSIKFLVSGRSSFITTVFISENATFGSCSLQDEYTIVCAGRQINRKLKQTGIVFFSSSYIFSPFSRLNHVSWDQLDSICTSTSLLDL